MRRTVTEHVEKTHSQHFYEGSRSETLEASRQQQGGSPKAATKASKAILVTKYLLLFITIVAIPVIAFYFLVSLTKFVKYTSLFPNYVWYIDKNIFVL